VLSRDPIRTAVGNAAGPPLALREYALFSYISSIIPRTAPILSWQRVGITILPLLISLPIS